MGWETMDLFLLILDAEEESSSQRDAIVADLTHKEILRPDAAAP